MSLEDICNFPLPRLDMFGAVLFLWRVSSMVEEAYQVCRAWGFVPKSEIVWVKSSAPPKLQIGMGHVVRGAHETCIVAKYGKPNPPEDRSIPTVFFAARTKHSAKPESFFDLVESLYPSERNNSIELFARSTRKGWDAIGDEL
jgi:N6-adenosine-specific RNA methylase IME4